MKFKKKTTVDQNIYGSSLLSVINDGSHLKKLHFSPGGFPQGWGNIKTRWAAAQKRGPGLN